jgi:hypothetical protein
MKFFAKWLPDWELYISYHGYRGAGGPHQHLYDVRYWHLVDNPTAPTFAYYWCNSGHSDVSIAAEEHYTGAKKYL